MRSMDPEHVALAEIDLSDPELWLAPRDHRERVFRTLRDEAPVQFFEEVEFPPFAKGPGYFALTRYEDVWMASRNPQLFCSGQGTVIPDMPIEIAEFFGSMISMDDPRHYRLRSIVAKAFTPKVVSQIEGYVRDKADGIVDTVLGVHGAHGRSGSGRGPGGSLAPCSTRPRSSGCWSSRPIPTMSTSVPRARSRE